MRWRPAAEDEKGVLQRYKLALALATLQQEALDFNDLASKEADFGATLARYLPDPPPDENTNLILALGGSGTFLPPLEPDIMGEYFLAKTLMEDIPKHRHTFLNAVLEKGKGGSVITLLRLQQDFPQKIAEIDLPAAMQLCDTEQAAYTYSFLAPNYTTHYLRSNAIPAANNFLNGIQDLTNKFPESNRIAMQEARAVFCMRGPEVDLATLGKNRVVIIGDSVAMGWGVSEEDTLRGQLADRLGPNAEVMTTGVGNMNMSQIVAHWLHYSPKIDPQTVVMLATARAPIIQKSDHAGWLVRHSQLYALIVSFIEMAASNSTGEQELVASYRSLSD